MNGLALSEAYYTRYGRALVEDKFPDYAGRIAAGLVGEGSECFGFDDGLSRDHDWGPGFCLWLNRRDHDEIGAALQAEYDRLPKAFGGYPPRMTTVWSDQRVGVFETRAFYRRFTGLPHAPQSLPEWCSIPEENLAAATNGRVFADPSGEFSKIRRTLNAYYPEDLRLKKMAARCMAAGQSGQYNFPRCARRGEWVAAHQALARYVQASMALAFSLGKRYTPFYKWMHRAMQLLPVLGTVLYPIYQQIVSLDIRTDWAQIAESIEIISGHLIEELKRQGLSSLPGDFLFDHGPAVHQRIQDRELKSLNAMSE